MAENSRGRGDKTERSKAGGGQEAYTERPFLMHFTDAIILCELAELLPYLAGSRHGALARSSVMAATFAIEAAANSLLEHIPLSKRLKESIENLQILEKFEFILRETKPNKQLGHDKSHTQEVQELYGIRNPFVHPKSRSRKIVSRNLDAATVQIEKLEKSSRLEIPASPEEWGIDHAQRALKAVAAFLDYFLLELCEFSAPEIADRLLSRLSRNESDRPVFPEKQQKILLRAEERWSIVFQSFQELLPSRKNSAPETQESASLKLLFKYSVAKGGAGIHDLKKIVEVEAAKISTPTLDHAVHQFLVWFAEAGPMTFGRYLVEYEVWDEGEQERYAHYRSYLSDINEPSTEKPEYRPLGRRDDVSRQLFINGIFGARRIYDTVILTIQEEDGQGRELTLPYDQAIMLRKQIPFARGWSDENQPDPLIEKLPNSIETKGRDFIVDQIEGIGRSFASQTMVCFYRAQSGNMIQIDMSNVTLLSLDFALAAVTTFAGKNISLANR